VLSDCKEPNGITFYKINKPYVFCYWLPVTVFSTAQMFLPFGISFDFLFFLVKSLQVIYTKLVKVLKEIRVLSYFPIRQF